MRRGLSNTMQVAPFACCWMNSPPSCFFCLNASQEDSVVTFCGYCPSSSSCPAYRLLRAHMNWVSPHKRSHIMADITHGSRRYSFTGQRAVIFGRCVIWQWTKQAKSFPLFKVTQKCHHLWNPCLSYLSTQRVNAPVKFLRASKGHCTIDRRCFLCVCVYDSTIKCTVTETRAPTQAGTHAMSSSNTQRCLFNFTKFFPDVSAAGNLRPTSPN